MKRLFPKLRIEVSAADIGFYALQTNEEKGAGKTQDLSSLLWLPNFSKRLKLRFLLTTITQLDREAIANIRVSIF